MTIAAIIAAFIANGITQFVKPAKTTLLKQEEIDARRTWIQIMNAAFGLIALIVSSILMGAELPADQVATYAQVLAGGVVTFLSSQKIYDYFK